jgi:dihydroceramide fatty acyl 2-hydroxylase
MMRATPESPRMFDRDLFDVFSRTHPMAVPILYVPGTLLPLLYGVLRYDVGFAGALALFAAGFVSWTLTEYWLHRLVFHFPARGSVGKRIHFLIHGVHHEWVRDKYRLVMPPAVSLTLYLAFALLFHAIMGPRWMWPFHAGFVAGYLVYDMTHYATHHLRPRSRWGRLLRRQHFLHHFNDETRCYGVSSPVWDWVFGTMGDRVRRHSTEP